MMQFDPMYYHKWVYNPDTGMILKHLGRSSEHNLSRGNWAADPNKYYLQGEGDPVDVNTVNQQMKAEGWSWDPKFNTWVPPMARGTGNKWTWNPETSKFDTEFKPKNVNWERVKTDFPYEEVTAWDANTLTGRRYKPTGSNTEPLWFDPAKIPDEYYE
jgi:hypothetical protein